MKAIMLSIQPQWVEKILNGEKTIEIRKTMPKCKLPVKVYIYETAKKVLVGQHFERSKALSNFYAGNKAEYVIRNDYYYGKGKVVAEFTLKEVYKYGCGLNPTNVLESACLTFQDLEKYLNFKSRREPYDYPDFCTWHISDLKIYDKPKELGEFKIGKKRAMDCGYGDYNIYEEILTRPPQSWCYVEEWEADNG